MHKLVRRAGFTSPRVGYVTSDARYIAPLLSHDRCCNRSINRAAKRIDIACLLTHQLGTAALHAADAARKHAHATKWPL